MVCFRQATNAVLRVCLPVCMPVASWPCVPELPRGQHAAEVVVLAVTMGGGNAPLGHHRTVTVARGSCWQSVRWCSCARNAATAAQCCTALPITWRKTAEAGTHRCQSHSAVCHMPWQLSYVHHSWTRVYMGQESTAMKRTCQVHRARWGWRCVGVVAAAAGVLVLVRMVPVMPTGILVCGTDGYKTSLTRTFCLAGVPMAAQGCALGRLHLGCLGAWLHTVMYRYCRGSLGVPCGRSRAFR